MKSLSRKPGAPALRFTCCNCWRHEAVALADCGDRCRCRLQRREKHFAAPRSSAGCAYTDTLRSSCHKAPDASTTTSEKQLSEVLVLQTRCGCHVPRLQESQSSVLGLAVAARCRSGGCDPVGVAAACGTHAAGCTYPGKTVRWRQSPRAIARGQRKRLQAPLLPRPSQSFRMQLPRTTVQTPSLRDIGRVLRSSLGTIIGNNQGRPLHAAKLRGTQPVSFRGYESDWASCAAASPGYIYLLYFLSRIGSWPVGRLIVLQHVEVAWLLNKEAPHQSKRKQSLDKGVLSGVGQRLPQICEDVLEECPCRQPRPASM